jgi:hypothetical protein
MAPAALFRQRAGVAVGTAGGVGGGGLAPVHARRRLGDTGRARAAIAVVGAKLAIGAAGGRRWLTNALTGVRRAAHPGAAVGVRGAQFALAAAATGPTTPFDAGARHRALTRAAVSAASTRLTDLTGARLVIVRGAHRQGAAVADALWIERAQRTATIGARAAELSLRAAPGEERAAPLRAGLAATLRIAAARFARRLARWRRRGAVASHTDAVAAIRRGGAGHTGQRAHGPVGALSGGRIAGRRDACERTALSCERAECVQPEATYGAPRLGRVAAADIREPGLRGRCVDAGPGRWIEHVELHGGAGDRSDGTDPCKESAHDAGRIMPRENQKRPLRYF